MEFSDLDCIGKSDSKTNNFIEISSGNLLFVYVKVLLEIKVNFL